MGDEKNDASGVESPAVPSEGQDGLRGALPEKYRIAVDDSSPPAPQYPEPQGGDEEAGLVLFRKKAGKKRGVSFYSKEAGGILAELVAQGMTLSAIADLPGMPSVYEMKLWEKAHADFRELLVTARAARAEVLSDDALRVAEGSEFKSFQADKIKIDTLRWLASAADPDRFGAKTKVTGDPNAPLTFLINTGIVREGDNGTPLKVELDRSDPAAKTELDPVAVKDEPK